MDRKTGEWWARVYVDDYPRDFFWNDPLPRGFGEGNLFWFHIPKRGDAYLFWLRWPLFGGSSHRKRVFREAKKRAAETIRLIDAGDRLPVISEPGREST